MSADSLVALEPTLGGLRAKQGGRRTQILATTSRSAVDPSNAAAEGAGRGHRPYGRENDD